MNQSITVIFTTRDEKFAKAVANLVSWIKKQTIVETKMMVLQENTKLFATDYWNKIFMYV